MAQKVVVSCLVKFLFYPKPKPQYLIINETERKKRGEEKENRSIFGGNTNLSLILLYTLLDLSVEYGSVEKPLILNLND